jgi:hypothetical protein
VYHDAAEQADRQMRHRDPHEDPPAKRRPQSYRGLPMTLANMREQGVRSLSVACHLCHHQAVMNVDAFGDAIPVPDFGPRMVCSSCGIVGADVRPNWAERPVRETLVGSQWRR